MIMAIVWQRYWRCSNETYFLMPDNICNLASNESDAISKWTLNTQQHNDWTRNDFVLVCPTTVIQYNLKTRAISCLSILLSIFFTSNHKLNYSSVSVLLNSKRTESHFAWFNHVDWSSTTGKKRILEWLASSAAQEITFFDNWQ